MRGAAAALRRDDVSGALRRRWSRARLAPAAAQSPRWARQPACGAPCPLDLAADGGGGARGDGIPALPRLAGAAAVAGGGAGALPVRRQRRRAESLWRGGGRAACRRRAAALDNQSAATAAANGTTLRAAPSRRKAPRMVAAAVHDPVRLVGRGRNAAPAVVVAAVGVARRHARRRRANGSQRARTFVLAAAVAAWHAAAATAAAASSRRHLASTRVGDGCGGDAAMARWLAFTLRGGGRRRRSCGASRPSLSPPSSAGELRRSGGRRAPCCPAIMARRHRARLQPGRVGVRGAARAARDSLHDSLCDAPGVGWRDGVLSGYAKKLGLVAAAIESAYPPGGARARARRTAAGLAARLLRAGGGVFVGRCVPSRPGPTSCGAPGGGPPRGEMRFAVMSKNAMMLAHSAAALLVARGPRRGPTAGRRRRARRAAFARRGCSWRRRRRRRSAPCGERSRGW